MKAQQKKLSGCASNLLAHEDLGHFEEARHWNIQAKFYNVKFPLVYENDNIGDSLYEEHGATLKHKFGKEIVTLPPFIFLFLLSFLFSFRPFFFLFFLGAMLYNDDHHTFIYLQLNITTRY